MLASEINCNHCGTPISAADTADTYSIRVDSKGYLLEILEGGPAPDALHYCSQNCMFKREQGVIPDEVFPTFFGPPL